MSSNNPMAKYQNLLTTIEYGNVYKLVMNRPTRKNALSSQTYQEIISALNEADANPNVFICVITGAGDFFTSGNDLNNFNQNQFADSLDESIKLAGNLIETFVNTFINFSKPLIAIVNGPAVGIGFTILAHCDLVIASEKATFHAPFSKLGLFPEASSSYTFPKLMGMHKALDILMFNKKITAQEAYQRNIVSEVLPDSNFQTEAWKRIESYSTLPKETVLNIRKYMRRDKEIISKVNKEELELLGERMKSDDFFNGIMQFFSQKSKL